MSSEGGQGVLEMSYIESSDIFASAFFSAPYTHTSAFVSIRDLRVSSLQCSLYTYVSIGEHSSADVIFASAFFSAPYTHTSA